MSPRPTATNDTGNCSIGQLVQKNPLGSYKKGDILHTPSCASLSLIQGSMQANSVGFFTYSRMGLYTPD